MNLFDKSWDKAVIVIGIFLVLVLLYSVSNIGRTNLTPLLYVPILYIISFVFVLKLPKNITTPGLLVVNGLYFLRYYALPLGILLYMPEAYISEYTPGTWLLLYEELFAIVAFFFFLPQRRKKHSLSLDTSHFKEEIGIINKLFIVFCVICIVLYLYKPSLYDSYHFITNIGNDMVDEVLTRKETVQVTALDNLAGMFIFVTYLMLPVYICLHFFLRYKKKPSQINLYLSILIPLFFSLLFIVETDRGGIIHRAATMIFVLLRFFPHKRNIIIKFTYIPALILVIYLITSRLFDDTVVILTQIDTSEFVIEYMQSYLANIKNCSEAINSYLLFGSHVNFSTPMNDILGNVPLLSHFADPQNNCNNYFATTIMRDDQVLPLVGNGLFYFGYILSPILSFITVKLLLKAEEWYLSESNPLGIYVYSYISIQLAFCHYQNVQLIFLYLSCMIAPIWLVFKAVTFLGRKDVRVC